MEKESGHKEINLIMRAGKGTKPGGGRSGEPSFRAFELKADTFEIIPCFSWGKNGAITSIWKNQNITS